MKLVLVLLLAAASLPAQQRRDFLTNDEIEQILAGCRAMVRGVDLVPTGIGIDAEEESARIGNRC